MEDIRYLCQKYNIRPSRRRGQNFLIDKKVLEKIIQAANLSRSDLILEIGPGLGVLTKELARRVRKVIAVELDSRLVRVLKKEMEDYGNVEIIEGDILKLQITNSKFQIRNSRQIQNSKKWQATSYKLIANLPYQITSPVLHKFLTEEPKPYEMILMVQKEVAERIISKPGKMNLLSILVQFYAQPELITYVSKNSFWPRPKVDSALIKISLINGRFFRRYSPEKKKFMEKEFFKIVRLGFKNRRKQLRNNLAASLKIEKEKLEKIFKVLNLPFSARAQELSLEKWVSLSNLLLKFQKSK
jgi:16S rRNA (adenine1518-N6/adenine1519-N6)-dimethyltransferase